NSNFSNVNINNVLESGLGILHPSINYILNLNEKISFNDIIYQNNIDLINNQDIIINKEGDYELNFTFSNIEINPLSGLTEINFFITINDIIHTFNICKFGNVP